MFDGRDTAAAAAYAGIRDRLRELLTDTEWRAAAASTLNAHYTDARIVTACWQALRGLGFTGGRVLEPGCGSFPCIAVSHPTWLPQFRAGGT